MIKDNNIEIITAVIKNILPKSEIILFGSRAKYNFTEESDYDLLIIPVNTLPIHEKRKYQALIRKKIAEYLIPADVIILNKKEYSRKKNITGHIIKQVAAEGIKL